MGITQRSDGTYEVRVTKSISGKVHELRDRRLLSKGDARRVEKEFQAQLAKMQADAKNPRWENVLEEYLVWYGNNVSASTYYSAEKALKAHTSSWIGRSVDSFTSKEIEEQINMVHSANSTDTKAGLLKYIRGVFTFALKRSMVTSNPATGFSFGKKKRKKLIAMTKSEITHLLRYTKSTEHPWYPIYRVTYELGLRSGEGLALKWDDIDFENNRVVISRAYCAKSKAYGLPKNGEARTIAINQGLAAFLKTLKLATSEEFVLPQINKWKRGEAAEILGAIQNELGIRRTNFHSIRASFITHLLLAGVPLTKVQHMVGHKELSTTEDYIRLVGSDLDGSTDSLALDLDVEEKVLEFKKN